MAVPEMTCWPGSVDVDVHPALPLVEALDQQPQVLTMQRSAVVLGVAVELGQWLAGGRAPELQFTVMIRSRHIDYDLEQLAIVHHPATLREVATAIRLRQGWQATLAAADPDASLFHPQCMVMRTRRIDRRVPGNPSAPQASPPICMGLLLMIGSHACSTGHAGKATTAPRRSSEFSGPTAGEWPQQNRFRSQSPGLCACR